MSHIKQPEGLGYLGFLVMFSKPLPMIRIYVTGDAWWSSPSILFSRSTMKQLFYCFLINGFVTCVASQDLQTVSIADRADFKVLRPCIHTCLFGNGDVAPGDGCGAPWYNQRWYSSINIAPSATRYNSTCIPTLCSDSIGVATGIDIYYDYCSKAGFPIPKDVARPVTTSVDLHVVSIYSRNDFRALRPCVTSCLYGNGDVAPSAGCGSPFYN
jgi:hypothetical protein